MSQVGASQGDNASRRRNGWLRKSWRRVFGSDRSAECYFRSELCRWDRTAGMVFVRQHQEVRCSVKSAKSGGSESGKRSQTGDGHTPPPPPPKKRCYVPPPPAPPRSRRATFRHPLHPTREEEVAGSDRVESGARVEHVVRIYSRRSAKTTGHEAHFEFPPDRQREQ
jgi:hypothetical protein